MKAALLVAGCGVYDGAEVSEVVLMLTALEELGIEHTTFAPDHKGRFTYHFSSKSCMYEGRNLVDEAARVSRSAQPLTQLNASDYDMLIIPGGFGVPQNLFEVNPVDHPADPAHFNLPYDLSQPPLEKEVQRVVFEFHAAEKAIIACCFGPIVLAKAFEGRGLKLTFGHQMEMHELLTKMGHFPQECDGSDIVIDREARMITTPAFFEATIRPQLLIAFRKALEAARLL